MARFDSHVGDRRPTRRASSSRALGFSSVVPTRSRLSSHVCFGAHCLPAPCSLLPDSRPAHLQNVTWRILFLFLHRNCGQYPSSSLFQEGFFSPLGGLATFDYVFICNRPNRLGGRPPEALARRRPAACLFLGFRLSAALSRD